MDHALFDWDDANIAHIAEHDITPDEAEQALDHEPFDLDYQVNNGEERVLQIGKTSAGRILALVSTIRASKIRVVTAYPAIRWQMRRYIQSRRSKLQ